ncbi:MAG: UDP-N-acetylmuramate dehydrogenase [Syntrophales bacterium]|nr:UDP-N-acetylmuramate dehydrogenase [Syntrophales bacterium]
METELKKKISSLCEGDVKFDVPMRDYTSMKVGGRVECLAFPPSVQHVSALVRFLCDRGIPFVPTGNGTNLIVREGGFRGVLLGLGRLKNISLLPVEEGMGFYAEAGASLREIINLAVERQMTGIEFLAGIPGSVGGAVRMNAGAWGREIKDVLKDVSIANADGEIKCFPAETLPFRYRSLELKPSEVIVGAVFLLAPGEREKIEACIEEIWRKRRMRHPLDYPSAGSIFKNPPGKSAGRLIEETGLKGLEIGGARVSEKHANFIVNTGSASASDVVELINVIKREVKKKHGITLETEVVIIGENGPQEETVELI